MSILSDDRIRALHAAGLSVRFDRTALLAGIAPAFSQLIPGVASPSEQLLVDLHYANAAGTLEDGKVPLLLLLQNATQMAGPRVEGKVFETALSEARAALAEPREARPPKPSYRDAVTRALGEELLAECARKQALEAAGAPTEAVARRILEIRRKLREGGQLREGDALRQYTLLEMIGRGGFAVVWKAFDRERRTIVAIKVLHPNLAGDPVRRERFLRGARVMAALDHLAIVKVISSAEEDEGFHFFVMEYVDGEDLQHAVLNGRVPLDRALPIVLAVGEALTLAHEKGFVHRDVKPLNILLNSRGEAKLTDFDLVGAGDTTGGTRTGAMGTFLYAAPELLSRPQDADPRADVYGLAMTAVFVLHRAPLPQTVLRHTDVFIDALTCSAATKAALKQALDWEPAQRFPDVDAFCEALRASIGVEIDVEIETARLPRLHDPALRVQEILRQADALQRDRKYEEAIAVLKGGVDALPDARDLRERLCDALFEAGDLPRAIVQMLSFARRLTETNDIEAAVRVLDEVLLLDPGREEATAMLGELGYAVKPDYNAAADTGYDPNAPLPAFDLDDLGEPFAPAEAAPLQKEDRSYDVAQSLDALDAREEHAVPFEQQQLSVESIFERFKASVAGQVADTDFATHYDLGVAYKEQRQFIEAIGEFEVAARDPARECVCLSMIGMLHLQLGNIPNGIEALTRSLHAKNRTRDRELALLYEIGDAYESMQNRDQALDHFRRLFNLEPKYFDPRGAVRGRLRRLDALRPEALPHSAGRGEVTDDFEKAFDELIGPFSTK